MTIDTKLFGMKSVSIPEGAFLCVEEIQSREGIALVEYNGYHHIEVPLDLCSEIPEDEEHRTTEKDLYFLLVKIQNRWEDTITAEI